MRKRSLVQIQYGQRVRPGLLVVVALADVASGPTVCRARADRTRPREPDSRESLCLGQAACSAESSSGMATTRSAARVFRSARIFRRPARFAGRAIYIDPLAVEVDVLNGDGDGFLPAQPSESQNHMEKPYRGSDSCQTV
jgi:hypothetical protein